MKLTFKMTGEEYYRAWKYKCKKGSINNKNWIFSVILTIITILLVIVLKSGILLYILAGMLLFTAIFYNMSEKRSVINQFNYSPINNGDHTVAIYDEGVELINSYEKVFAPWQSIFAVKETHEYIIILLSFSKGMAVINKQRYAGNELDSVIGTIKSKVPIEEGKR